MNMKSTTKRGLIVWLVVMVLFGVASGFGRARGSDIVLNVADRFHEARCAKWNNEKNIPRQIEEYKAWLWLDPYNIPRSAKLVELHLQQGEVFEAYNRVSPLIEKMDKDEYILCRLMTMIRTAQQNPEALDWGRRMLAVANESQQAEATGLLHTARQQLKTAGETKQ